MWCFNFNSLGKIVNKMLIVKMFALAQMPSHNNHIHTHSVSYMLPSSILLFFSQSPSTSSVSQQTQPFHSIWIHLFLLIAIFTSPFRIRGIFTLETTKLEHNPQQTLIHTPNLLPLQQGSKENINGGTMRIH